jgi:hypothetical protein
LAPTKHPQQGQGAPSLPDSGLLGFCDQPGSNFTKLPAPSTLVYYLFPLHPQGWPLSRLTCLHDLRPPPLLSVGASLRLLSHRPTATCVASFATPTFAASHVYIDSTLTIRTARTSSTNVTRNTQTTIEPYGTRASRNRTRCASCRTRAHKRTCACTRSAITE